MPAHPRRGLRLPTVIADQKKQRRLEITAGAPKHQGRSGIWATNQAMREAERALARQAETSCERFGSATPASLPGDTGAVTERNVLGGELEPCGIDPITGFYRDGCCRTGPEDRGSHTICAVVTSEFLEHQRRIGNDLITPMPQYHFPGLAPGDRWCVTALNWLRAHEDGSAAYVVLASTHERALEVVSLAALQEHTVDVPPDPGPFGG